MINGNCHHKQTSEAKIEFASEMLPELNRSRPRLFFKSEPLTLFAFFISHVKNYVTCFASSKVKPGDNVVGKSFGSGGNCNSSKTMIDFG